MGAERSVDILEIQLERLGGRLEALRAHDILVLFHFLLQATATEGNVCARHAENVCDSEFLSFLAEPAFLLLLQRAVLHDYVVLLFEFSLQVELGGRELLQLLLAAGELSLQAAVLGHGRVQLPLQFLDLS